MPFTGYIELKRPGGKKSGYLARLTDDKPQWYAVWGLMADSPKPKLYVHVELLKNFNTPPNKLIASNEGKIPARSWISGALISPQKAIDSGLAVDMSNVPPRPHGKGWAKKLQEVYPR